MLEDLHLFSHQEVLAELIRKQGLHEGRWSLVFELQHVGTTINALREGISQPVLTPAAVTLIQRVGITRTTESNELTLDASEVNPNKAVRRREGGRRGVKKARKN